MKKMILPILLLLSLALGCCACSGKTGASGAGTDAAPAGTPEQTAAAPDEAPAPDETSPSEAAPAETPSAEAAAPDTFNGSPVMTMGCGPCAVIAQYDPYDQPSVSGVSLGDVVYLQIFGGMLEDVRTGDERSFALQKNDGSEWKTVHDGITEDASVAVGLSEPVFQAINCLDMFETNGDGHYRVIKRVLAQDAVQYHTSDFYVLKTADPKQLQKSVFNVDPREELSLSVQYPSNSMTLSSQTAPGSVDLTLSLLKDTGIDPICGNAADCIIEEQIGGEWYTVPRPNVFMTLEGYAPAVGMPVVQEFSLSGRVQHPGHYRLLKPVSIGRGSYLVTEYYAAEFDVTAPLP